jgi:hypothetical protein
LDMVCSFGKESSLTKYEAWALERVFPLTFVLQSEE